MSNRRESLKKSLGITEYPWSSDDDDIPVPESTEENTLRRQQPEPRPSVDESAGTSGEPPPQPRPSSAPDPPTRGRSMAQVQARRDRDMFWSLLNHRTSLFNATRPLQHTPAPDLIERPRVTSAMDINRILALKRSLNRSYTVRPRMRPNTTFYAVPATRPIQYASRSPSYTPPSSAHSAGNVHTRSNRLYPTNRRARSMMQSPYTGVGGVMLMEETVASSSGMSRADVRRRVGDDILPDNNADNTHSDDEIEITHPSTTTADNNNDDNNAEQENNENVEETAQNTAEGAISLEEEIVEMDASEVTISERDRGIDEDVQNDDETQEVLNIIEEMDENSARNSDEGVDDSMAFTGHTIKRRRDGTVEINIPYTIQAFNQSLLRLLECPVCLEWMEPPIAQCRRGHLVCGRCRSRLTSCPVCRTMFSSVRNRAMEGVAEMLRYPCRHGCGREVRLRRRGPHEASCSARKYYCPAPACAHRNPLPRDQLATHFQSKHLSMLKIGSMHNFTIKINAELSDDWLIMSLDELFHLRVDVDVRTWGVIVYVAYIGPKCNAINFMYEVTVDGHHNARRLNYTRATHSDLDIHTLNLSRHDCFSLTLDQAANFLRFNNRNSESERFLDFSVEVKKCTQPVDTNEDVDS